LGTLLPCRTTNKRVKWFENVKWFIDL
jgi:hypothetical protein